MESSRWCGLTLLGEQSTQMFGIVGIFHLLHAHLALVNTITFQNVRDIGGFPKSVYGNDWLDHRRPHRIPIFFGLATFLSFPESKTLGNRGPVSVGCSRQCYLRVFSFTHHHPPSRGNQLDQGSGFDASAFCSIPLMVFAISSFLICIPLLYYQGQFQNVVHFGESTGGVMPRTSQRNLLYGSRTFLFGEAGRKNAL